MKMLLVIPAILLAGCMTDATQTRFTAEGANSQACKMKMIDARVAIAKFKASPAPQPTVMFSDERNALMYLTVKQMGEMNIAMIEAFTAKTDGFETCDDVIVAMVRSDAAKVAGVNGLAKTAISWTAGLIGLGIISDNWGPSNYGSSGDSWHVNNSRVVSKSGNHGGNASSSGTGLGVGNTAGGINGADAVGGFYPRSQADLVNNANGSQSNSGELNADPVINETPVQLPAP